MEPKGEQPLTGHRDTTIRGNIRPIRGTFWSIKRRKLGRRREVRISKLLSN